MPDHRLGWEDGGLAQLVSCGAVNLHSRDMIVLDSDATDDPVVCPNCGRSLRLIWRVFVEVVD